MENLNVYKKVQIILLILIIISGVVLTISAIKKKDVKNVSTAETLAEMKDFANDTQNEIVISTDTENADSEENPEDTSWDDEEDAKDTKVDPQEAKNEENNKTQYYIKVNYTANCVTVYKKDDSGNYTIPVKALICSTGAATPRSGVYKTSQKYRWHQLNGGVYGQYCTRITGHILFHSVPCSSNTPDSLKYVAYDKLGTTASAGCVRLTVEGAMWIYNNCASGTYVEFYSSSNPGPLGKPTARKISSNVQCRNWDPTDPDPRNPWHNYVEPAATTPTQTTPAPSEISQPQEPTPSPDENTSSGNDDNSNSQGSTGNQSGQSGNDNTQGGTSDDKKDNTSEGGEQTGEGSGGKDDNTSNSNTEKSSEDSSGQTSP